MGIRSIMNEKPVISIVVVAMFVGAAVWIAIGSTLPPQIKEGKVYFSADDGKTWFADRASTVTPYTKDGQEVVRAYVCQCKDGKPFVGLLSKQNPNAPSNTSGRQTGGGFPGGPAAMAAIEFKRPGESSWEMFGKMSPASKAKMNALCPDGGKPEMLSP